eukprot:TRINITY_DN7945_c0_g1_i1.p1 TRINITY_DN7945_c0_g1~~TRINITY_DN7945_c0_g1_i1.p1  ORF type:complete len:179 (-),score=55.86 TRINITY_DN7945_c0_g1_i1:28-564(-)
MAKKFKIVKSVNEEVEAFQASEKDEEEVMGLLIKTARWLKSRGSVQWNDLLEGKDKHGTAQSIKNGDVYIFKNRLNGMAVGVVVLFQNPTPWDINLWGQHEDTSIYLHRLTVDREFAGKNLGREILRWVHDGILFEGKSLVRLDCYADNINLNKLYSEEGFTLRGTVNGFSIYDKPKQ